MNTYNRQNPFQSKLIERTVLNPLSDKKTYHLKFDISNTNIQYTPGDSLAVLPQNEPSLIERTLEVLNISKEKSISHPKTNTKTSIYDFFLKEASITKLSNGFFKYLIKNQKLKENEEKLQNLLDNRELLKDYIETHALFDTLIEFPIKELDLDELCQKLLPLIPRLYSITSACKATPNSIELIVAHVTYEASGYLRKGVCSTYLCECPETHYDIYVQPSHGFHLPKDPSTDILMIGSGTGIAPFRAFILERIHKNAPGKNWLFFGEKHRKQDFFYEDELKKFESENKLKLSLAFSRDQKEKIYVQHILLKEKDAVWKHIQDGGSIYVCGDAKKMAKDIELALIEIAQEKKDISNHEAIEFIQKLREDNRYLRDVY
ncbi:MAG TPA: hypothetical protein P5048_04820 [Chlamydiales bacterium]|nr:hypothetical protein [Chlamydiales bacterium]